MPATNEAGEGGCTAWRPRLHWRIPGGFLSPPSALVPLCSAGHMTIAALPSSVGATGVGADGHVQRLMFLSVARDPAQAGFLFSLFGPFVVFLPPYPACNSPFFGLLNPLYMRGPSRLVNCIPTGEFHGEFQNVSTFLNIFN